jgi:hypothetical protein
LLQVKSPNKSPLSFSRFTNSAATGKKSEVSIFLQPQIIAPLSVLASFAAWCVPEEYGIRKGYFVREPITLANTLWLTTWYLVITISGFLGFRGGRATPYSRKISNRALLTDARVFYSFTIISLIGVSAAYYNIIEVLGAENLLRVFQDSSANELRAALYTGYSIGLASLRYSSGLSGGLAMFRIVSGKIGIWDVLALLALVGASAISGRIIFMLAIWVFLSLWTAHRKSIKGSVRVRLFLIAILAILALWGFNYSRNANYYRSRWTDGFWMAGVGEIVAYLSAPFQVALGVGNNIESATKGVDPATYADWEGNLTTNSAFQELLTEMGWLAFGYIALMTLAAGWVSGWCSRQVNSYFILGFPVVSYAFAELWRLDLFGKGIFQSLLAVSLGVPLCYAASHRVRAERPTCTPVTSDGDSCFSEWR